ncbi:unnamed protein product [Coccothraustes coccothraustes]
MQLSLSVMLPDKPKPEALQSSATVTCGGKGGQQPSEEELGRLEDTCDTVPALSEAKLCIYEYVESCGPFIDPSLSLILRASVAAKIMGVARGLTLLSCNLLLGASPPPPSCPTPPSATTATSPGPCCRI